MVSLDVLLESFRGSVHNFLLLDLELQLSANGLLHVLDFGLQKLFHFVIFILFFLVGFLRDGFKWLTVEDCFLRGFLLVAAV